MSSTCRSAGGCSPGGTKTCGFSSSATSERVRSSEHGTHLGLEVRQRQRVVVGIEGLLIPLVGEPLGELELVGGQRVAVLLAGVRVAAEVVVVVPALEV